MSLEDFANIYVRDVAPILYTSYRERLRLYMGINPEYLAIWFSSYPNPRHVQLHIAFIRSCRQIHYEAG